MSTLRGDHALPAAWNNARGRGPTVVDAIHATVVAGEALIRAVVSGKPSPVSPLRGPASAACAASDDKPHRRMTVELETLVYELLDAHADTADLAAELVSQPRWAAQVDYLRALQRTGREALARMSVEDQ